MTTEGADPGRRRRTVVGVDASPCSRGALRWALADAADHGASLEAVYCVELGGTHRHPVGPAYRDAAREDAAEALAAIIAAERAAVTGDRAEVDEVVVCVGPGSVARALVDRAADADLLVVGSHGRGGLSGLVLGSVSRRCVEDATTPVVVVPPGAA